MRQPLAYIFIVLSWPVCLIHRFWNNEKPHQVDWFVYEDFRQDIQWYICDTGNMLSFSFILLSFIFLRRKTIQYSILLFTIFVISLTDVLHYWLAFKQWEWVVQLQGLLMLAATLLIFIKSQWRRALKSGRQ